MKIRANNSERRFGLINILCLVIGITISGLLFFWVVNELSYDHFNKDGERIYRLVSVESTTGIRQPNVVCRLYKDLPAKIPQIEDGLSFYLCKNEGESSFSIQNVDEDEGIFVDAIVSTSNFFSFFSYPIVEGFEKTDLEPGQVAVSKDIANRLFGKESALGKSISVFHMGDKTVSEIVLVVDVPANTHLPFDIVVPKDAREMKVSDNATFDGCVYVKTYPHAKFSTAEANRLARIQMTDYDRHRFLEFQPLYDIHLHSDFDDPYSTNNGKSAYVWIIIVGMVLIIVVMVLNCATLDVSRMIKHTKDMAVRKVFGGNDVVILAESAKSSFLNTAFAIVSSLLLIFLLLPVFQSLMQSKIQVEIGWPVICFVFGLLVILPLSTVMFQYYCLHSVRLADILKSRMRFSKGIRFSNGVSVFQVAVSALMAVFTFTILLQLSFMRNHEDGINTSDIVSINALNISSYEVPLIKEKLLQDPRIVEVGLCEGSVKDIRGFSSNVSWEGKEEDVPFYVWTTDASFMKMIGLQLIEGRFLDENLNVDDYFEGSYAGNWEYVINETAAAAMGMTAHDAIGKRIETFAGEGGIVGVVKDFNFRDLHDAILPLVMLYYPENQPNVMVKIMSEEKEQTLAFIKDAVAPYLYTSSFDYRFVDDKKPYRQESQMGTLSMIFFIAALLLSLIGFAAIISYHINQEAANMAIRKVYGATPTQIGVYYINRKLMLYVFPLIAAIVLSCYVSMRWLRNFAFHISDFSIVIVSLCVLLVFVLLLSGVTLLNVNTVGKRKIVDVLQK